MTVSWEHNDLTGREWMRQHRATVRPLSGDATAVPASDALLVGGPGGAGLLSGCR
jgi:hypothetical protein